MESAWPRTMAASDAVNLRGGSGRRALPAVMPGRSAAKETSSSGFLAMARRHPVTARLNGSVGLSLLGLLPLTWDDTSLAQRHVHGRFRQLRAEAALIKFSNDRPLQLIAFVDEGEPEGKADVLEDVRILGPGDHRPRAHHGGNVAVHEGVTGKVGDANHLVDNVAALIGLIVLGLGKHDLDLIVVRQIVESGDDRPAVHLALVDLLRAVVEPGRISQAH